MLKFILALAVASVLISCNLGNTKPYQEQIKQLEQQLEHSQNSNASLLQTMEELSVINKTEAKSIQSSLESISRQNEYIQKLTSKIHHKDSVHIALVTNLKRSLLDVNDEDIFVEVKGSAVYVSIADRMLFRSGSTSVSTHALDILGKVATVINDHKDLEVQVEGHTDDLPIATAKISDNWDLSVLRATSVVRVLTEKFMVDPQRLTAAGRSFHSPKEENDTYIGRSLNRRTEIIITPKLDQFFELLKATELVG